MWLPPNKQRMSQDALERGSSKTQIPKVMFLAALGFPRPEYGFDGDIGIWPVTCKKTALRTSKYHAAGDEYLEVTTMDTKKFIEMMKELVIPAAIEKVKNWATTIVFQMDSAGGHGVKMSQNALTYTDPATNISIRVVLQPTKSPDLNILDLGAWYSLQVAVDKYKRITESILCNWKNVKNQFIELSISCRKHGESGYIQRELRSYLKM